MVLVIQPGGAGNVVQSLVWKCGVPDCGKTEEMGSVFDPNNPDLDPMAGPEGWRLLEDVWVCPDHLVAVHHKGVQIWGLFMDEGTSHWQGNRGL